MHLEMKNLLFITLVFIFGCKNQSSSKVSPENLKLPIEAHMVVDNDVSFAEKFKPKNPDEPLEDTLFLKTTYGRFQIFPTGLLKTDKNDTIQLGTDLNIDKAYLYQDSTCIYIFFTDTDYESSSSWIQKINNNSFNNIYTEPIQGFNLGSPLIKQGKAFLTAMGYVAKLDLESGKYDWAHPNLYDKTNESFNNFDSIVLRNGRVVFLSNNNLSGKTDSIIADEATGEIIQIIK